MTTREIIILWALTYLGALTAFAARVCYQLFGIATEPPEDPAALTRWQRKRRWLLISEFSALPMFTTLAVASAANDWLSPVSAVIWALVGGALGFGFFLHALEIVIRRRFNLEEIKP